MLGDRRYRFRVHHVMVEIMTPTASTMAVTVASTAVDGGQTFTPPSSINASCTYVSMCGLFICIGSR